MDVNMISSLSQQTATVKASLTKSSTTDEATRETTTTEAFSLEISAKSEKAGWFVLMLMPQSEFSAGAMSVSSAILTAAIIALVAIAIVTALASRAISKPVEELADAMDETQLQDLHQLNQSFHDHQQLNIEY